MISFIVQNVTSGIGKVRILAPAINQDSKATLEPT